MPGRIFCALLEAALPAADVPDFAARFGVSAEQLASEQPVVLRRFKSLWQELERATGDQWIGLRAATQLQLEELGQFYRLLASCPDLRSLLEVIRSFTDVVHSSLRITLRVEGERAIVEVGSVGYYAEHAELDFNCAIAWRVAKTLLPALQLTEAQLPFPPDDERRGVYESAFQCPVRFGCEAARGVFPAELLDLPLPHADEQAHRDLEEWATTVRRRVAELQETPGLRAAYRRALDSGEFSLESVAKSLELSPSRLRNMLHARKSSHTEELDLARRQAAAERLRAGGHSVEQIARELGFSHQSAFTRAFRRWTGLTPSRFGRRYRRTAPRTLWIRRAT